MIDSDDLNFLNIIAGGSPQPLGPDATVGTFVGVIVFWVVRAAIAFSMIGVLLSGIKFMTSRGDERETEKAKNALTYSTIAFLLSVGAGTIAIVTMSLLQ